MPIVVLLGKSRWRRRKAIPTEHLAGVDPFGRPTFVYLTDTWRKAREVERGFVERRDVPTFAPEIRVLTELLLDLHTRWGTGDAVLSPGAVARIAWRMLADQPGRWPWLEALGAPDEVGRSLARLRGALIEADTGPHALQSPHQAELTDALQALDLALGRLDGWTPREDALRSLLERLRSPGTGLARWLGRIPSLVIDDILAPSPLRIALLIALMRGWSRAGTQVVLSFETGRDLGGREAGLFFEYDDADGVAYGLKPFAATRAFRRSVFDQLISSGEAEIAVGLGDRVVPVEPFSVFFGEEKPDLADRIYGSGPVPVRSRDEARELLGDTIRFLSCTDPHDEIRSVARQIKQLLRDGERPGDCVVAIPELATTGPILRSVFDDHGIPYAISAGDLLASHPLAQLALGILEVAAARDVGPRLQLLQSSLIRGDRAFRPAELLRWCRSAGIREGDPLAWRPILLDWAERSRISPDHVEQQILLAQARLAPLSELVDDRPIASWTADLRTALEALGIADTVGRLPDSRPEDDPIAARELRAWAGLLDVLATLAREGPLADPGPWSREDFAAALADAVGNTTVQPETPGSERVQVVGALELRGLTPRHTFVLGLIRGQFPAAPASPWIVPPSVTRSLRPFDPLAEARYLIGSLIRNALDDDAMASLTLSWPRTRDGRGVAPSAVIADILSLPTTGGALLGDWIVDLPHDDGVVRARSEGRARGLLPPTPLTVRQAASVRARRILAFTSWDGVLPQPPSIQDPMSVTALETYLKCPARYWYGRVLRLDELDPFTPELSAARRGTAVHRILESFLTERQFRPIHPDEPGVNQALHAVATRVLAKVEEEGGFEPAFFAHRADRWLAGLIDERPAGLLRAWLDRERTDDLRLQPLAAEQSFNDLRVGRVRLRGTLDRLDRVPGTDALLVTDYKTGQVPSARAVRQGLALQPIAYAAAVARQHPDKRLVTTYYQLKRPDQLRRAGWTGDGDLLDLLLTPQSRRFAVDLDHHARAEALAAAAQATERLARGIFHPTLADPSDAGCSHCSFRRVCRTDPVRAERIRDEAPDPSWQAPREAP